MTIASKKANKHSKEVSLVKALDSLNNNIDAVEAKAKKIADEYLNKVNKFTQEYKKIESSVIIPSMQDIMKIFNTSGHAARVSNKNDETNYQIGAMAAEYLGYYFQLKNKYSFIILISGNTALQKVHVGLFMAGEAPKLNHFNLNEITKNLLESIVEGKIIEISSRIK